MTKRIFKTLGMMTLLGSLLALASCAQGPHEEISFRLLATGVGLPALKEMNLDRGRANYLLFSDDTGYTQITDGINTTYTVTFTLSAEDPYVLSSYANIALDTNNTFYTNTSVVITPPEGQSILTFVTYDPYLNVRNWIALN